MPMLATWMTPREQSLVTWTQILYALHASACLRESRCCDVVGAFLTGGHRHRIILKT